METGGSFLSSGIIASPPVRSIALYPEATSAIAESRRAYALESRSARGSPGRTNASTSALRDTGRKRLASARRNPLRRASLARQGRDQRRILRETASLRDLCTRRASSPRSFCLEGRTATSTPSRASERGDEGFHRSSSHPHLPVQLRMQMKTSVKLAQRRSQNDFTVYGKKIFIIRLMD